MYSWAPFWTSVICEQSDPRIPLTVAPRNGVPSTPAVIGIFHNTDCLTSSGAPPQTYIDPVESALWYQIESKAPLYWTRVLLLPLPTRVLFPGDPAVKFAAKSTTARQGATVQLVPGPPPSLNRKAYTCPLLTSSKGDQRMPGLTVL